MSPLQRARWGGGEGSSQARDHHPVRGGHVSVPRAGTRAAVGAGAAGVHPSYGGQVGVVQDGKLQGEAALYAGNKEYTM